MNTGIINRRIEQRTNESVKIVKTVKKVKSNSLEKSKYNKQQHMKDVQQIRLIIAIAKHVKETEHMINWDQD